MFPDDGKLLELQGERVLGEVDTLPPPPPPTEDDPIWAATDRGSLKGTATMLFLPTWQGDEEDGELESEVWTMFWLDACSRDC